MYDVIIIGAGIVGCAVARALSRYQLDILVMEKGADVAVGATKANSGILHAGYDCAPGTLKATLNVRGLQLYKTLAQELGIPHRMNGSLVVSNEADTSAGLAKLRALYDQGIANGVTGLELLDATQTHALEPNLHPSVNGALRATTAGIISPYEAAIAFAENAATNGVRFLLETTVTSVCAADNEIGYVVYTDRHGAASAYHTRVVINAAGTESGVVANHLRGLTRPTAFPGSACDARHKDIPPVKIHPQRGQYYLLDNTQRDLISHTVFQLPTHKGKGVLIAPTVEGNVLLGPTAEAIDDNQRANDPAATATTRDGLAEALDKARLTLAHVPIGDRITAFAGVRAKHNGGDFIVEEMPEGFISAIGIDSPGLTAAPAIAERLAELALTHLARSERAGSPLSPPGEKFNDPVLKSNFINQREPITRLRDLPPDMQARLVATKSNDAEGMRPAPFDSPVYGSVVCRCETITQAEITEAMRRFAALQNPATASQPVAICDQLKKSFAAIPANLDAIKRRSRAQMGRCQGGFCTVRLVELISREHAIPEEAVTKNGQGSEIVQI